MNEPLLYEADSYAVELLHEKHRAQLMNYLKMTGLKLGMLVNFGAYPKVSIVRIAN